MAINTVRGNLNSLSQISPVTAGLATTVTAANMYTKGDFQKATLTNVLGITAMNLSIRDTSPELQAEVLKTSFLGQAIAVGVGGLTNICQGIRQKEVNQVVKGAAQTLFGVVAAGVASVSSPKSVALVTQAATLASLFGIVAYNGAKEVRKGNYLRGVLQTAGGIAGIVSTGYLAYRELNSNSVDFCPYEDPSCSYAPQHPRVYRKMTISSIYEDNGNKGIKDIAEMVDMTHKEYAERWGLIHNPIASKGTLVNQCRVPIWNEMGEIVGNKTADCSAYWPKMPEMVSWLNQPADPSGKEEWLMLIDYDGPITNMKYDPYIMPERLSPGSSVILTKDSAFWLPNNFPNEANDPDMALNGGFWLIKKNAQAEYVIREIWEQSREQIHDRNNPNCLTWGTCKTQECLHEQQGTVWWLKQLQKFNPSKFIEIWKNILNIVLQRNPITGYAVNTSTRNGCFIRVQEGWREVGWDPRGIDDHTTYWRYGDFMGQPNGVPPYGRNCDETPDQNRELRKEHIQYMIDHIER